MEIEDTSAVGRLMPEFVEKFEIFKENPAGVLELNVDNFHNMMTCFEEFYVMLHPNERKQVGDNFGLLPQSIFVICLRHCGLTVADILEANKKKLLPDTDKPPERKLANESDTGALMQRFKSTQKNQTLEQLKKVVGLLSSTVTTAHVSCSPLTSRSRVQLSEKVDKFSKLYSSALDTLATSTISFSSEQLLRRATASKDYLHGGSNQNTLTAQASLHTLALDFPRSEIAETPMPDREQLTTGQMSESERTARDMFEAAGILQI